MEAEQDRAIGLSMEIVGEIIFRLEQDGVRLPIAVTGTPRCVPGLPENDPRVIRNNAIVVPPLQGPPPRQGGAAGPATGAAGGLPM